MMKSPWTRRRFGAALAFGALLCALPTIAAPAGAQPFAPEAESEAAEAAASVGYPVAPGTWKLHGNDPELSTEDLEPLKRIIGRAPVVALGESYHTTGGQYILKHRIFRYLVENMGFRAFAIESNWTGVDKAARYVQTCEGTPDEALTGHWAVFQSRELADLAQWMCEWNRSHSNPADKLHFFGFDIQQPQDDGPALIAFLQRIGIAESHAWVSGIRACDGVVAWAPFGQVTRESHEQCLQALRGIELHFNRNRKAIEKRVGRQGFTMGRLNLTSLRASQLQNFIFPHDFPTGITVRDEGMANAFLTLRSLRAPRAKTVIWAANMHVARSTLSYGAKPMGSFLAAALRRDYVTFAINSFETEIDYPQFGCGPVTRAEDTVEERLHQLGEDALLVDLAVPGAFPRGWHNMGIERSEPHRQYNGMFHLARSPKMVPLRWPSCR